MMEWEPALSVGIEEIDGEHRQIRRRARQLESAIAEKRPNEIRAALKFLDACLREQFAIEESWMADMGYPGAAEHGRTHASILNDVAAAREGASARAGAAGTAEDLVARLDRHMRSDDLKLGQFHTARENLRLLAEAGPGVGASLTPIPGMLRAVRPTTAPPDAPAPGQKRSRTDD